MNDRLFDPNNAHRLEDPERLKYMPPQLLIDILRIQENMVIVEIGAGTGYFTIPLARVVGPEGRILAVDLQPEMLHKLAAKMKPPSPLRNVILIQGSAEDTGLLDAKGDLVLLANVWHELNDSEAVLREARRLLKEDGHIAILDWRPDVERPPGPTLEHRLPGSSVKDSLKQAGWKNVVEQDFGQFSYLVTADV